MATLRDDLSVLARADADRLKALAETLIPALGDIEVVQNRTGLVMLPMRDTAGGVAFHLGEVLVAEAHIRAKGQTGYGMRRGHDLEAAMAMALADAAMTAGVMTERCAAFCAEEAAAQAEEDRTRLRKN